MSQRQEEISSQIRKALKTAAIVLQDEKQNLYRVGYLLG